MMLGHFISERKVNFHFKQCSIVQKFTTTAELNGHRASCPVANLGYFQKMNGAFNRTAGYSLLKSMDMIYISFILLLNTCINLVKETNIKGAIAIAFAPEIDCSQLKIIFPDLVLQIPLLLSLLSLLFFCFGQFLFADSLVVLLVSKFPDLFN